MRSTRPRRSTPRSTTRSPIAALTSPAPWRPRTSPGSSHGSRERSAPSPTPARRSPPESRVACSRERRRLAQRARVAGSNRPGGDSPGRGGAMSRRVAWPVPLGRPLALVLLLRSAPAVDARWEDRPAHFWIVLAAGVLNAALALAITEAGRRRRDARLLLIGLAFLVSAGFLGLHALATPGEIVSGANAGFVLATPVGLGLFGSLG